MALKAFLLFLLFVAFNNQVSRAQNPPNEDQNAPTLQNETAYFISGDDDDALKHERRIKRETSSDSKPLSLQLLQNVIADCVKDVERKVNCKALIPVDKTILEKNDTGIKREEYLKNKANDVLKQLENIITKLNTVCKNISDALNEEINKTLNNKLREVVDTFQLLIEIINSFPDLNCTRVNITEVKETTQKYIDQTSENIKNIFSNLCFLKFKQVETEMQALENKSRDLLEKYSAENVNIKCKKLNPNVYIYCVNATYNEFQITVNALEKKRKEIEAELANNITKEELNLFYLKIATILKAVKNYVNKTAEKLNELAEIPKQNDVFLKASIRKFDKIIGEQVDTLAIGNIKSAIIEANTSFENISNKFVADLKTVVTSLSGNLLNSKDEAFIQEYVDLLNSEVKKYTISLNESDYANLLLNNFVNFSSHFTVESLKVACTNSYCNATGLAACVNAEFEILNKEVKKAVENLKALQKTLYTKLEIISNISVIADKLLKEANNSYVKTIADKNSPEDSAAVISECLERINDKGNDEILQKMKKLFALPNLINDFINSLSEKIQNLDQTLSEGLQTFDARIDSYPEKSDNFIKQKEKFIVLGQQAKANIKYILATNQDRANSFVLQVEDQQKILLSKLSNVTGETLKQFCQVVYRSKKNFTLCVGGACNNILDSLSENELAVLDLELMSNVLIKTSKNEIAATIEEESKRLTQYVEMFKNNSDESNSAIKCINYINSSLDNNIERMNRAFVSAFKRLNELIQYYDWVPIDVETQLVETISSQFEDGEQLTEADRNIINEIVNKVKKYLKEYRSKIKIFENEVINYEGNITYNRSSDTDFYRIYELCGGDCGTHDVFTTCVENTIRGLIYDHTKSNVDYYISEAENVKADFENSFNNIYFSGFTDVIENYLKNRESDANNPAISAQLLTMCGDAVDKRIKDNLNLLSANILTRYDDVMKTSSNPTSNLRERLQAAYKIEIDSLDYVISLNPKDAAKYKTQKDNIIGSIDEITNKINNTFVQNLQSFGSTVYNVYQVKEELSARQSALIQNLSKSCEAVYSSKENYSKCIGKQCTQFSGYLNETENALKKFRSESNDFSSELLTNIPASVEAEIENAINKSNIESVALLNENGITEQTIINLALSELSKYNVTPYFSNLKWINQRAAELENIEKAVNKTVNDVFRRLLNAINLHKFTASQICPKVTIGMDAINANKTILDTGRELLLVLPSQLTFIKELFNFSSHYEALLNNEIQLLQPDNVKSTCVVVVPDTKLYQLRLFECVKGIANNFIDAFTKADKAVSIKSQDMKAELINRTNILARWRDNDFGSKYNKLLSYLQTITESIYASPCNATKDKLLNFIQLQIDNRFNRLKLIIDTLAEKISAASDAVISRNFKNIAVNNEKLNSILDWYKKPLEDAKNKNISQEKIDEAQKVIGGVIASFDTFIEEVKKNASLAKTNASQLVAEAQSFYETTNKKAVEAKCYKENVTNRYSAFIECSNGLAYDFEVGLLDKQKKLADSLNKLNEVDSQNGNRVVNDFADQLEKVLKNILKS